MRGLVLSIFPGIGMLDMAFEEAGFSVVRGPDLLWGGDVRRFTVPAGRFDGVIGGPPCKAFSRMRHIIEAGGKRLAPDLIPEYSRVVREAAPAWYLMENVPDAPEPDTPGYDARSFVLAHRHVGGTTLRRRRFTFGTHGRPAPSLRTYVEFAPLEPAEMHRAVTCDGREVPVKIGGSGQVKATRNRPAVGGGPPPGNGLAMPFEEMCRRSDLPADFLSDAPFTVSGKREVVGNGVPLKMGRAVAAAVCRYLDSLAA